MTLNLQNISQTPIFPNENICSFSSKFKIPISIAFLISTLFSKLHATEHRHSVFSSLLLHDDAAPFNLKINLRHLFTNPLQLSQKSSQHFIMQNWKRGSIKLLSGLAHCLLNKGLLSFIKNLESLTCSSPINQSSRKNLSKLFTERRKERCNPAPSETHCSEIPEDFKVDQSQLELRDSEGNTPLLRAVLGNRMDAVQWLVENGANIDATNNEGNSALHLSASKESSLGIARYLIDNGTQLELQNRTGDTPLHYAALVRNSNFAHLLIEKGANVNAVQESGCTALHFAIAVHAIDIARDLIHNGAQLEAREKTGQTPLFFAVRFNTLEGVKLLVENGADVNAKIGG